MKSAFDWSDSHAIWHKFAQFVYSLTIHTLNTYMISEPYLGCFQLLIDDVFWPETANTCPNQGKMGIKQFNLVCIFIICCLFSFWNEDSENSQCTVVILPLNGVLKTG